MRRMILSESHRRLCSTFNYTQPARSPILRLHSKQMPDVEVRLTPPVIRRPVGGVPGAGDDQQVEVLAGLDQSVHDLHRRSGIHIRIQLSGDEQQFALQLGGIRDVRLLVVPLLSSNQRGWTFVLKTFPVPMPGAIMAR
jgi:hypothetical protein